MTNKATNFATSSAALACIPNATMDSAFENSIVSLVRTLDVESAWEVVRELLTHPKASARALGLRVVRRQFRDKTLLLRVVHLCFEVERLAEIQYWYAAILARYPVMDFICKLETEAVNRRDPRFIARHIRALQMHRAAGSSAKQVAVAKLIRFSSSQDWAQFHRQQTAMDDKAG